MSSGQDRARDARWTQQAAAQVVVGWLGGGETPVLLLPWGLIIGGLWRAALGAVSR